MDATLLGLISARERDLLSVPKPRHFGILQPPCHFRAFLPQCPLSRGQTVHVPSLGDGCYHRTRNREKCRSARSSIPTHPRSGADYRRLGRRSVRNIDLLDRRSLAGYTMLWTALITTPMMAVIDGVCARIGAITGGGLMRTLTGIMPRPVALMLALLVLSANTLNVGADINGMAASAHMLLPVPSRFWILLFTGIIVVVEVFYSHSAFARIVKWLCMSLFAYVITAFIVHPPWKEILGYTFVPHFVWTASWLTTLTGVLGTTITPYLFFWQASMTVENTLEHSAAKQPPPPSAQTIQICTRT